MRRDQTVHLASRRELLRYGAAGVGGVVLGGLGHPHGTVLAHGDVDEFTVRYHTFTSDDGNASITVFVPPSDVCSPELIRHELLHAGELTQEIDEALNELSFGPAVIGMDGLLGPDGRSLFAATVDGGVSAVIETATGTLVGFDDRRVLELGPSGRIRRAFPFTEPEAAQFWLDSGAQEQLLPFGPPFFEALNKAEAAGFNVFPHEQDCLIAAATNPPLLAACFLGFLKVARLIVRIGPRLLNICRRLPPGFLKRCWARIIGWGILITLGIALVALIA